MMQKIQPLFFIGPVPPPLHGFSAITQRMLSVLSVQGGVSHFDTAAHNGLPAIALSWFTFAKRMLVARPRCLYVALSGGYRQLIDCAFILVARLMRVEVFVHHHSFAYLNKSMFVSKLVLSVMRNAKHIVLCERMGERLVSMHKIPRCNIRVLSNAAFLDEIEPVFVAQAMGGAQPLRIGFLSNITAEKGIFEFFAVMREANVQDIGLSGVIAGPVGGAIAEKFSNTLSQIPSARHIGPVYGSDKTQFFSDIDVLLFPTLYANEAEPVTILEALAYGVPVIALSRGCIESLVPLDAGVVLGEPTTFSKDAMAILAELDADRERLQKMKQSARLAFDMFRLKARGDLDCLIDEMMQCIDNE